MAHLILHIGSHKTGTSSIQYVLTRSAEALEKAGASYLQTNALGKQAANANTLAKMKGKGAAFTSTLSDDVADALIRPEAKLNILSSENLFWLHDAGEIARLAKLIQLRFESVSVIAYLRRQDMLALSHRKQVISPIPRPAARFYGYQMSALPEHQPHFHTYFDYHAKLEMWREAFGTENMQVALFQREALKNGDSVADFFARAGLQPPRGEEPVRRNTAVGRERTLLALAAKAAGIGGDALKAIRRAASDEGKLLPARADAQAFLANWADSNARLAQAWKLPDGSPFVFSDDFSMYPEVGTDVWSDAEAREAIAHIMTGAAAMQMRKDKRKGGGGKGELRAGAKPQGQRGRKGPGKGHGGGGAHGAAGKPGFRKRKVNRRARKLSD